ncbi:hypothetical protein JCM10908_007261 [Rhodotorula pacifica]|uniref:uncharacterized protein n=1 Tax=Rhodotorula pacifica TaxID=1495444 RepID=UPI00317E7144
MSFSPRARPNTVNLPFSDADITDTYRDDRSSNNASSPRHRHPLGDSPLSRRGGEAGDATGSSSGRFASSSRGGSYHAGSEADNTTRIRSNLDKLLDLLDQDDEDVYTQTSGAGTLAPGLGEQTMMSTPPPPQSANQSNFTPTSAHPRPSASYSVPRAHHTTDQPPLSPASHSESGRTPTHHPTFNSARPPLSARGSTALELLQRANGFDRDRDRDRDAAAPTSRSHLPDSPSPRPGSVAALRRSDVDTSGRTGAGLQGEQDESGTGLVSGLSRMAVNGDGDVSDAQLQADRRSNGSLDSIARVAEAAQREFDEIVSDTTQADGRPASRLRSVPTPHRSESLHAPAVSQGPYDGAAHPGAGVEQMNQQLVQELREAQDYIAYLQEELRAISEVVIQLREQPEDARAEGSQLPYHHEKPQRSTPRQPAAPSQDWSNPAQASAQAAFEIMQHTLATIPSLIDTSAPIDSFARTLSITRRIDQLAHRTRDVRRDEDIFSERNLTEVLREVETWAGSTG